MWRLALVVLACGCDQLFELPAFPPPDAAPVIVDGLVARYTMDELRGGTTLLDIVGGHHGTCSAPTCPAAVPGMIDGALRFDGAALMRIEIPNAPVFVGTTFTITAFLNLANRSTLEPLCPLNKSYGAGMTNSWQLCVQTDNRLAMFTSTQAGPLVSEVGNALVVGEWSHVAIRFDGVTRTITLRGADVGQDAGGELYDDSPISIGADRDGANTTAGFYGAIDDVRIYNRLLTLTELEILAGGG